MNKRFFFLLTAATFFALLCGFSVSAQTAELTYDSFGKGTFHEESTPKPEEQTDPFAWMDEMIFIPEGPFLMGNDSEDALNSSRPAHEVTLKGYWIDRYEVTNHQYAKCVATQFCTEPKKRSSATRPDYFGNSEYAAYPVIYVDYYQAAAYCNWAGKRLPTEAEWEKVARGEKGLLYPWGNKLPKELPAQINLFESGDTAPVNAFPEGISPYGIYNMEGNVWEWTADQFDQFYYSKSPARDPQAVTGGNDYVIRGFSWAYPFSRYEITTRNSSYILNSTYDLGFRCAADEEL